MGNTEARLQGARPHGAYTGQRQRTRRRRQERGEDVTEPVSPLPVVASAHASKFDDALKKCVGSNMDKLRTSIEQALGDYKWQSGQALTAWDLIRLGFTLAEEEALFSQPRLFGQTLAETGGDQHQLVELVRNSVVGEGEALLGPYGPRRITVADYTASGRCLSFIEEFIQKEVMPLYANTHSETSGTGRQTTKFREDARHVIKDALNCNAKDCLLFCGSGSTGAVNKLIDVLNLRIPNDLDVKYKLRDCIPENHRPVVFIGPFEHHSNELPWRETIAEVVVVDEDENGHPDLDQLERELVKYQHRPLKIGSFSAASNVTGIGIDTGDVAALLHRYGAYVFFDFAAAGPYVQMDMNLCNDSEDGHLMYKDAIFLSPHKFIGGPGTPGLLVAKRWLFHNKVPAEPGGGTVSYVSPKDHRYVVDPEHREEGGTPAIIESIRCGLVFQLKEAVGPPVIRYLEESFVGRATDAWKRHSNIIILGNLDSWRLAIISFCIRYEDRFLHHNFVVALLNDLFGIQARGGCSCAGPYGHRLLQINLDKSRHFEKMTCRGYESLKPGWVRVNFNYFISETVHEFLVEAVLFVAEHGWKFLPFYKFNPRTGDWGHCHEQHKEPMSLFDVTYKGGRMEYPSIHLTEPESAVATYLEDARAVVEGIYDQVREAEEWIPDVEEDFHTSRWFVLPHEVRARMLGKKIRVPKSFFTAPPHRNPSGPQRLRSLCPHRAIAIPGRICDALHHKSRFMEKTFDRFDSEGTGLVTHTQFQACLKSLGIDVTEKEVLLLLLRFDVGNQKVNYEEFSLFFRRL